MITRDEIIKMAREAGFETQLGMVFVDRPEITSTLERFAALVAAAEREAILREAHPAHYVDGHCEIVPVAAIRARSKK